MEENYAEELIAQSPYVPVAEHRGASRQSSARSTTAVETSPPPPPVAEYQTLHGGRSDELHIPPALKASVLTRLKDRAYTAKEMVSRPDAVLSSIDKMLLESKALERIEAGEIGEEEMALMYYAIEDELHQELMAAALTIREQNIDTNTLRGNPLIYGFSRSKAAQLLLSPSGTESLTTAFTRKRGSAEWTLEDSEDHIRELAQLTMDLQKALTGRETGDPILQIIMDENAQGGLGKTGDRLYDTVVEQARVILAQQYEGKSYAQLEQESPEHAARVWYEARQQAAVIRAETTYREILTNPGADINIAHITHHINVIDNLTNEPTTPEHEESLEKRREKISAEEEGLTKLSAEQSSLSRELAALEAQLPQAENDFNDAQDAHEIAKNQFDSSQEGLNRRIEAYDNDILHTQGLINDLPRPPDGTAAKELTAYNESLAKLRQTTNQLIDLRDKKQAELDRLAQAQTEALITLNRRKREFNALKERKTKIKGDESTPGLLAKTTAEIEKVNKSLSKMRNALESEEKGEKRELSEDEKNKKSALTIWRDIAGDEVFRKIISARFKQHEDGDEFTLARLASTQEIDNQFEGAELLREHIFSFLPIEQHNTELARQMVSDEALAKAIIYIYRLNTSEGSKYDKALSTLNELEDPDMRHGAAQALLADVLPNISQSDGKVGELLRFVIRQGLKSAAKGTPYLQLSSYFEKPQEDLATTPLPETDPDADGTDTEPTTPEPEEPTPDETSEALQKEVLSLIEPKGEVLMRGRTVEWTGIVPGMGESRRGDSIPLTVHLAQEANRDSVNFTLDYVVNNRFFQTLPDHASALEDLPEDFREQLRKGFYDMDGNLRTSRPIGDLPRSVRLNITEHNWHDWETNRSLREDYVEAHKPYDPASFNFGGLYSGEHLPSDYTAPKTPLRETARNALKGFPKAALGALKRFPSAANEYRKRIPDNPSALDLGLEGPVIPSKKPADSPYVETGRPTISRTAVERLERALDTDLPNLTDTFTADLGGYVIQRSPEERQNLLKGLSVKIPVYFVPVAGSLDRVDYDLDYDNEGKFYIEDPSGSREELLAFLQRRTKEFKENLGVDELNEDQKENLRNEFIEIQKALGREVLRAQQRR